MADRPSWSSGVGKFTNPIGIKHVVNGIQEWRWTTCPSRNVVRWRTRPSRSSSDEVTVFFAIDEVDDHLQLSVVVVVALLALGHALGCQT